MPCELRRLFRRIALNSLWLLLARLSSQGLAILFTALVAQYLGEAGLGRYAFVAAVIFLGNGLTTFGQDTLLIREVARAREAPTSRLAAALWVQLGLSLLFIGGVAMGARWLPDKTPDTILALRLYSLALIPMAFTTAFHALLRAHERMAPILIVQLISAALQAGGALAILRAGGDLIAVVLLLLAVHSLSALLAGVLCLQRLPGLGLRWRVPLPLVRSMLRQGARIALVTTLMVAYQRLGVLLLSLLADDATTGWFAAAARITDAFKMAHYAYFGAIFPLMSRLAVGGAPLAPEKLPQPIERGFHRASLGLLLGMGLAIGAGTTALAGPVVRLLYGPGYEPSIPALQLLIWSLIPFAVNVHVFFWLVSTGQEPIAARTTAIALGGTALLGMLLIPPLGLMGACAAILIGEVLQMLLYAPHIWHGMIRTTPGAPALLGARPGEPAP